jgi:uncharacterized protein (DUF2147 family)
LWAIDTILKSAVQNFYGVYLHTREHDVQYNLFEPREEGNSLDADWRTGSTYYSMLFLSEMASPNGSIVIDLNVDNSTTNVGATTAAYGVYDNKNGDGNSSWTRGKLVLINYAESSEKQEFWIPANVTNQIRYRMLSAGSVYDSGASIVWAGQNVGLNGALGGEQVIETADCSMEVGCSIEVPSPGAMLVLLDNDADFYQGNSTIAPPIFHEGGNNSATRVDGKLHLALTLFLSCFTSSMLL